jgi:flagellar protein FliS
MHVHLYVENEVWNRSPVELVRLLYSKAIEKLNQARAAPQGNDRRRNADISRAMEILAELQGSLNFEAGGEIAANLARLYEYLQHRLLHAMTEHDDAALAEAVTLFSEVYAGWTVCNAAPRNEGPRLAPASSPQPLAEESGGASGRSWTL